MRAISLLALVSLALASHYIWYMYLSWMICSGALGVEGLFVSIHSCVSGAGSLIAQLVLAE